MRQIILVFLIALYNFIGIASAQNLSLKILDSTTHDAIPNVSILIGDSLIGSSNNYGYFSHTAPCQGAAISITLQHISYQPQTLNVSCGTATLVALYLTPKVNEITRVTKKGDRNFSKQFGQLRLPASYLKTIPFIMGEVDALKAVQTFPGVTSSFEANSGIYVRGGNIDQCAIYLDDAPVYNIGHFYGFFSPFDGDALKSFTFYNSGIYSGYGSRGSSILDVRFREGSMKSQDGSISLGLLTSKALIEGYIVKDKFSYLGSVRFAYPLALYNRLQRDRETKNQFIDGNVKLKWVVNAKNNIYLSAFGSSDQFSFGEVNGFTVGNSNIYKYAWSNKTATLRWNHIGRKGAFVNTIASASRFDSRAYFYENFEPDFGNTLNNYSLKSEWDNLNGRLSNLRLGYSANYYHTSPAVLIYHNPDTVAYRKHLVSISNAIDAVVFGEHSWQMKNNLLVLTNIRLGIYRNLDDNYTDMIMEPRIKAIKRLKSLSLYAAFDKSSQYQNYVGNRQIAVPSDYWLQASDKFKGQKIYAYTLGASKEYSIFRFTLEGFYKQYKNALDVRDGGNLFRNLKVMDDILTVQAHAYGMELLVEKHIGKFQGHCSYTLSRSERRNPSINSNQWFASNFDRTHILNTAIHFKPNKRWDFGFLGIFQSGTPVTANYAYTLLYSLRNEYRLPYYYRVDASITKHFMFRKTRECEWNISVFNVFFIKNRTAQYPFVSNLSSIPTLPSFTLKMKLY